MLKADLQRLRDDNRAITAMLQELENSLGLPLPPEPPFPVMADVITLQDRLYAVACRVGNMKREIRDRILQHTLAADDSLQGDEVEAIR
jgi:hypothetical protein